MIVPIMPRRILTILALFLAFSPKVTSQETTHSERDLYFDFLALEGEIERPYLNYKTMADSNWGTDEGLRIYGPEIFSSYNSAAPFGVNDGVLWQGRGINTSITAGMSYTANGIEIVLMPTLVYSQNQAFDLMPSAYESEFGYIWGYGGGAGVDAPQRFGDKPMFNASLGDSEIRFSVKTFTLGVGTQSPWVGPGRINAIMHSNNAVPYPKVDFGIRKTPFSLFSNYLGDIEARMWAGYLSESAYFDSNPANDHYLITALSVAFAPAILPGLSFFANRSYLAPWKAESLQSLLGLLSIDLRGGGAQDEWDQRASIGFDYLVPGAGFEVYGEAGINDYAPSLDGYIRYPFHSMVFTGGMRKAVRLSRREDIRGELLAEWTNLELSQDFQFQWPATFYMHHQIVQGYANGGQWLGAGTGTGGNSQYLGFKLYYPRGSSEIFIQRVNPDNDYLYRLTIINGGSFDATAIEDFRADLSCGIRTNHLFSERLGAMLGLVVTQTHNPNYESIDYDNTQIRYNLRIETRLTFRL